MATLLSENWVGAPGGACEVGAPDVAVGARREGRAAGRMQRSINFLLCLLSSLHTPVESDLRHSRRSRSSRRDPTPAPRLGFPKPVPTPRLASCTHTRFDHARRSMGAQSSSIFEPWSTGSSGLKLVAVQRSVRLRL